MVATVGDPARWGGATPAVARVSGATAMKVL